ncbi:hypothetical protein O181_082544 [Austropuccinia psidii MF-1]|uniref:Uncharacterized protein n=1 Tax=Austropuccinia psidii MF-1 TaxID=1389203 RepID=A0A9Q3IL46_9BASI|nr:hypothetical protein [Austropuccinia psidii MF-1]
MTSTRSGSNYSILLNGSGPGQECQPKVEAQTENSRASTSFQRLAGPFETLIESPKAGIINIPVVRPDSFQTGNSGIIPVSVQELLDTYFLQGTSPKDKNLVKKSKHFVRGPEERVGPKEVKHPSGSSSILQKQESASTSAKQVQAIPEEQSEGQAKGEVQVEPAFPTELNNSKE